MKCMKCLKIAPEAICEQLKTGYQPVVISDVELNLNELAVSLIEALMSRVTALEACMAIEDGNEQTCPQPDIKEGRLIASYLITV